jgi:DNA-binding beta-propeller fold protein YncE
MTWGTKGNGPGEFNLPHSIDIDRQRRVYVADRANSRIQVFDENGKYLDQWPHQTTVPYHDHSRPAFESPAPLMPSAHKTN